MIPIQRLSIEELEALEWFVYCYADTETDLSVYHKMQSRAIDALVKLRAVVPLPHRAGTAGDVMCCVERVDQDDFSFPPCAKDAPELPQ